MRVVVTESLSSELAKAIMEIQKTAEGRMNVAVSGGSLIGVLKEAVQQIDTANWDVFLADERCVSKENKDSNTGDLERQLGSKWGARLCPPNHSLWNDPAAMAREYDARLQDIVFDALFLGMGPDGHVCSLFPDKMLLGQNTVGYILDSPKPPPQRISLTIDAVCRARNIVFVVGGANKVDAVRAVFEGSMEIPALHVTHKSVGNVVWIIEKSAWFE